MNKKNKLWIPIVILLIIVLSIISYFTFVEQSLVGSTTLSIDKVNLASKSDFFSGETWIITLVQGRLAQSIRTVITPEEIGSKTSDGSKPTKDLEILVDYRDQSCEYIIKNQGQDTPIYKIEKLEWACAFTPSQEDALQKLENTGISKDQAIGYYGKYVPGLSCFATYWKEQTKTGVYSNANIRSVMDIAVIAGDNTDVISLDSLGDEESMIGDFGYVEWVGNLDLGESCPYTAETPYKPAYYFGTWRNIRTSKYETYINKFDNRPSSRSKSDVEDWINDVNNAASESLIFENFGYFERKTDYNKGKLKYDIGNLLQKPVLTFYIKADSIGIYTPSEGDLKIISGESPEMNTGDEGIIYITAKNIGDERGTWNFYADCDDGFELQANREYSFNSGEQKKVSLPLGVSTEKYIESQCEVCASNSFQTKCINVDVSANPLQSCIPNSKSCGTSGISDVVYKCSSDGVKKSIDEICDIGEVCLQGKCKGDDGIETIWEKISDWFKNLGNSISDFFGTFQLVISIVLGLLATLMSYVLYGKIENMLKLKNNNVVTILISVLMGFLVGFLIYTFFWWGILGLVIYLIISFIVPKK